MVCQAALQGCRAISLIVTHVSLVDGVLVVIHRNACNALQVNILLHIRQEFARHVKQESIAV